MPGILLGHCSRLNEIESSGHFDGPIGGGNDIIRAGCINGYFFNHKAQYLFYESFIKPSSCKRIDNVVPFCDIPVEFDNLSYDELVEKLRKLSIDILVLTDNLGFDSKNGIICKFSNRNVLEYQLKATYMHQYPFIIDAYTKYSEIDWLERYRSYDGHIPMLKPNGYVFFNIGSF